MIYTVRIIATTGPPSAGVAISGHQLLDIPGKMRNAGIFHIMLFTGEVGVTRSATLVPWLTAVAFSVAIAAFAVVEPIPRAGTVRPVPAFVSKPGEVDPAIRPANFVGATGCAAASCHGGDVGHKGGEYATWAGHDPLKDDECVQARDPHSRAYRVLFNAKSERIARNLTASLGKEIPAHENSLCLKCHSQPDAFQQNVTNVDASQIIDRNVGCESCHGPAEHYLSTHYLPEHLAKSPDDKARDIGLFPTKDLAFRTQLCASCHIGDGSREVNHDLIAAGHPRLNFEYTRFHHAGNYQKHWKEPSPNFTEHAWSIGQVATLRSAISALQKRAELAINNKAPWPEFAEYSCYACHQNLGPDRKGWSAVNETNRTPGSLAWGTWTLPMLDGVDDWTKMYMPQELKELQQEMERPQPSPAKVAKLCKSIDRQLGIALYQSLRPEVKPVEQWNTLDVADDLIKNALNKQRTKLNSLDWDGATQLVIALQSLYRNDFARPKLEPTIAALDKELKDPAKCNPETVLKLIQELHDQVNHKERKR